MPGALEELPVQRPGGKVERAGVDADLAALSGRYRGELREADVIADAESDAGKVWAVRTSQSSAMTELKTHRCQSNLCLSRRSASRFPSAESVKTSDML